MRQIKFARVYPAHHPKKGQPTNFATGVCKAIYGEDFGKDLPACETKWHTVREGENYKPGDQFSPTQWTGRPYHSKVVPFTNAITVQKTFKFRINKKGDYIVSGKKVGLDKLKEIAKNDGFSDVDDFELWFKGSKEFKGQIISWSKTIKY